MENAPCAVTAPPPGGFRQSRVRLAPAAWALAARSRFFLKYSGNILDSYTCFHSIGVECVGELVGPQTE